MYSFERAQLATTHLAAKMLDISLKSQWKLETRTKLKGGILDF